jgi:hypothetical protein
MADQGDITRTSPEALRVNTSGFALAIALIVFFSSLSNHKYQQNKEFNNQDQFFVGRSRTSFTGQENPA